MGISGEFSKHTSEDEDPSETTKSVTVLSPRGSNEVTNTTRNTSKIDIKKEKIQKNKNKYKYPIPERETKEKKEARKKVDYLHKMY